MIDNYIKSLLEDNTLWVITLNNDDIIHQDDGRPNHVFSAWLRLKQNIEQNQLWIKQVDLIFRSNKLTVFSEQELNTSIGLFFKKSILAGFGGKGVRKERRIQRFYYIFGLLKDKDDIQFKEIHIPSLIINSEGNRKFKPEFDENSVIWKK